MTSDSLLSNDVSTMRLLVIPLVRRSVACGSSALMASMSTADISNVIDLPPVSSISLFMKEPVVAMLFATMPIDRMRSMIGIQSHIFQYFSNFS